MYRAGIEHHYRKSNDKMSRKRHKMLHICLIRFNSNRAIHRPIPTRSRMNGSQNQLSPTPDANRFTPNPVSPSYCCSHPRLLEMSQRNGSAPALSLSPRPVSWQTHNCTCHSTPGLSLFRFETSAWGRGLGEETRKLPHGDGPPSHHWVP